MDELTKLEYWLTNAIKNKDDQLLAIEAQRDTLNEVLATLRVSRKPKT